MAITAKQLTGYENMTPSQRDKVNKVIEWSYALRNSNKSVGEKLNEFKEYFQTNGLGDIKNLKGDYAVEQGAVKNEFLGNQLYGVSGTIVGFTDKVLVAAAAGQQQAHNGVFSLSKFFGFESFVLSEAVAVEYGKGIVLNIPNIWNGKEEYLSLYATGDNPDDFEKIMTGIKDANNAGIFGYKFSDTEVAFGYIKFKLKNNDEIPSNTLTKEESLKLQKLADFFENLSEEELESKADEIKELLEQIDKLSADELKEKLNSLGENQKSQDGEKINFDGLENTESQEEQISEQIEQIEQNNEEQNTSWANGSATNIVELAKQNVSLYNQNINKGYDDIMGFLFA